MYIRNYNCYTKRYIAEAATDKFKDVIDNPTILKHIRFESLNRLGDYLNNVKIKEYSKELRARSELLIFKDDMIFMKLNSNGYEFPGGGWEEGETHLESAMREAKEEAYINTKNGVHLLNYASIFKKPPEWAGWAAPKEHLWYGEYTEVFGAEYNGSYKGKVAEEDQQKSMKDNGKFYKLSDVYNKLLPIHREAVDKYMK